MMALALLAACLRATDVHAVDLADVPAYLAAVGAERMEPPVPIPHPAGGTVEVWLALPDEGRLALVTGSDGRAVLAYPPGTTADRVEWRGDRVVDVRGTRIDADGRRWHHVYRAAGPSLVGVEWPAGDPALQASAADLLVDRLRAAGARGDGEAIRRKLDCDGCHVRLRPEASVRGEHGVVARGTDDAAFFTPSTLLRLDGVVEAYGVVDTEPWHAVRCADGTPPEGPNCADGSVRRAWYALADALAAGDPRASAVCRSWRALELRLPELGEEHPCRT